MREQGPMTQTIKSSDVRQEWSEVVSRVYRDNTRVVVEKSGIPVAAIISARDLERFRVLECERAEDFQALHDIGQAFKDVPVEVLEQEVVRAISHARVDKRTPG